MANLWSLIQSKQYQTAIEETLRGYSKKHKMGAFYM
jgi:hypothetical protein